jgi:NAD(P) transhydrogenase
MSERRIAAGAQRPGRYDLVVIGSGPAGQKAAIAAAKLGKRVAVIDREPMIGGGSLHTGTIPSKTLREAALYLSGLHQRTFYGQDYALKENIAIDDLTLRVRKVVEREGEVVRTQLHRNGIDTLLGWARFQDAHTLKVESGPERLLVRGEHILIACGAGPAHDHRIAIDGRRIFDSDQLGQLKEIPHRLIVVGAGVIGLEYASVWAALGREVTVIDQHPTLLDFVDHEIVEMLVYALRRAGMIFRLGEKVAAVAADAPDRVVALLESGKKVPGDALLYAVGRRANTDRLNLEAAGLAANDRGRLAVNDQFQTAVPHIYAAGDVIGFPALASTSMEQGRLAARHMFGAPAPTVPELLPYGIYTIPEISMVGQTEQQLTAARVPYEVGVASYAEVARGQILGDETGLLKLLFDPESLRLLGVHAIGESAVELIHIGQAVLALGGTVEYFRDAVFNYPTLAEAYKVAALNGLNKL